MKKILWQMIVGWVVVFIAAANVYAHCEIPCGIYDDEARITMILEHASTIEKSMNQITLLGKENPLNNNQLVRWIVNKEQHADAVQEIVSQYFMTQRIKPDAEKYSDKLSLLHQMLLAAMKCKQTTDTQHVDSLRDLTARFKGLYFAKK